MNRGSESGPPMPECRKRPLSAGKPFLPSFTPNTHTECWPEAEVLRREAQARIRSRASSHPSGGESTSGNYSVDLHGAPYPVQQPPPSPSPSPGDSFGLQMVDSVFAVSVCRSHYRLSHTGYGPVRSMPDTHQSPNDPSILRSCITVLLSMLIICMLCIVCSPQNSGFGTMGCSFPVPL